MKIKQSKPSGCLLIEVYIRKYDGCTHTEISEALNLITTMVGSDLRLVLRERSIERECVGETFIVWTLHSTRR